MPPPPLVPGGGAHSLAREGVGESQVRREDIYCGSLYIYVLFVMVSKGDLEDILGAVVSAHKWMVWWCTGGGGGGGVGGGCKKEWLSPQFF